MARATLLNNILYPNTVKLNQSKTKKVSKRQNTETKRVWLQPPVTTLRKVQIFFRLLATVEGILSQFRCFGISVFFCFRLVEL